MHKNVFTSTKLAQEVCVGCFVSTHGRQCAPTTMRSYRRQGWPACWVSGHWRSWRCWPASATLRCSSTREGGTPTARSRTAARSLSDSESRRRCGDIASRRACIPVPDQPLASPSLRPTSRPAGVPFHNITRIASTKHDGPVAAQCPQTSKEQFSK